MSVRSLLLILIIFGLTGISSLFITARASPSPGLTQYTEIPYSGVQWIEIQNEPDVVLLPRNDDRSYYMPLGFEFPFYDQTFTSAWVCSNGFLSFGSYSHDRRNFGFPITDIDYMIAPFWDDINMGQGGDLYVFNTPDYFVAEWKNVHHFRFWQYNGILASFEVILHKSGRIDFVYESINYLDLGYTTGLNYGLDTTYYNEYKNLIVGAVGFSITYLPELLPATVDFHPETLNRKSQGNWVTVYIELPAGYDVEDIDISTVNLNGEVPAEVHPTDISDGILMVKFSRAATIEAISEGEFVDVTITGNLLDGTPFEGFTNIRALF